jgi:predicted peroxiredoxin
MAKYLFISARDPYDSPGGKEFLELVHGVRARDNGATLFLVQNGVLNARHGALHSEVYRTLAQNGVAVLADSFSLRERAIGRIAEGVKIAEIDQFVDLMLEPQTKAIWN